jgi:nickel-dependent lactate racemase
MKQIKLPWGAWNGDCEKTLIVPGNPKIDIADLPPKFALSSYEIKEKLSPFFKNITSHNRKNIVIVIDDLTRPIKIEPLFETIIEIFRNENIENNSIKILIGLGGHRELTEEDLVKKIGTKAITQYKWINHNPLSNLARLQLEWKGTPVELNEHFVDADYRIIISCLVPHSFAGFSGGAKMLFPGIANFEMIKRTHKSVMMGFMGKLGEMENNRFRHEIEELTKQIGVNLFIGLIGNQDREIIELYCGDVVEAHRKAANYARNYYTTNVESEGYDMIILNAYPKDTELLQLENAFIPLHSASRKLLKDNGVVLVTSACSEGMGYHALFGPDNPLYRKPLPKRFLSNYDVLFYSENINEQEFRKIFWEGYRFFSDQNDLYKYLQNSLSQKSKILVFPCASIQMVG